MQKIFKKTAILLAIIMLSIIGIAGFYQNILPDTFCISNGGKLMINSLFSISAKPCESKVQTALNENFSSSRRNTKSTLMLFGAVPIKEVTAKTVDRPLLIPCGQAFGIKLITDGVMVVDLTKVEGKCPAKECGIKEGDIIISINGETVKSNSDVSKIITNSNGKPCEIKLKRDGVTKKVVLHPAISCGTYKAGMWVRDSSAGIGTLTFYDPETTCFGGLGHPICDSDTKEMLPLSKGVVGDIEITGCTKSENKNPGQLLGEFKTSATLGTIYANCEEGVFGTLNTPPTDFDPIELGFRHEISTGVAEIYSSVDGKSPKSYEISIEKINLSEESDHDLVIKITDENLISQTGGIVQGMSGSPIIQNGRIVGAVTHVFIEDTTMGYGIFADKMYEEAVQALENAG